MEGEGRGEEVFVKFYLSLSVSMDVIVDMRMYMYWWQSTAVDTLLDRRPGSVYAHHYTCRLLYDQI